MQGAVATGANVLKLTADTGLVGLAGWALG